VGEPNMWYRWTNCRRSEWLFWSGIV